MKEYEVIHEIMNACAGRKRGDVVIEEVEIDDLEAYVQSKHQWDSPASMEKQTMEDGTVVYIVVTKSMTHQYTFSPL